MVLWQAPRVPLAGYLLVSLVVFCASLEMDAKGVELQVVPGPPSAGPPLLLTRNVQVGAHRLFLPESELAQSGEVQWQLLLAGQVLPDRGNPAPPQWSHSMA